MLLAMPRGRGLGASAALALALVGCATAVPGTQDPSTVSVVTGAGTTWEIRRGADIRLNQPVNATPPQAWAALPGVFAEIGLEPDLSDPARMELGVSAHRFSTRILDRNASDFFECGLDSGLGRPLADQAPITARVVTTVLPVSGKVELRTVVQGTARRTGGNAGTATCTSTGLLEVLVGRMVQAKVGPPA